MFITFEMDGEHFMYNVNNIISLKQQHEVISIRTINVQDNFTYKDTDSAAKNFLFLKGLIDNDRNK